MEASNKEEEDKVPEGEADGDQEIPVAPGNEFNMLKLKDLMAKVNAGWEAG